MDMVSHNGDGPINAPSKAEIDTSHERNCRVNDTQLLMLQRLKSTFGP